MTARNCTTHHYACDCREAMFAEMVEALESMWNSSCTNADSRPSKDAFLKARTVIAKAKKALAE